MEKDIGKIITPDFDRAGRCSFVVEVYKIFESLNPDMVLVVAYGKILPKRLFFIAFLKILWKVG